jgi:hypothetical protein
MATKGQETVSRRYALDQVLQEWIKFIDRSVNRKATREFCGSASLRHFGAGETEEQKTPGVGRSLEPRPTKAGVSL